MIELSNPAHQVYWSRAMKRGSQANTPTVSMDAALKLLRASFELGFG